MHKNRARLEINMNELGICRDPISDTSISDKKMIEEHNRKLNTYHYSDAVKYLDDNHFHQGFRSSVFNSLETKIRKLQVYLLNQYVAASDEFYSIEEPSKEQMQGKAFWVQPL